MGQVIKDAGKVAGATMDPLNLTGMGGIPGLNGGNFSLGGGGGPGGLLGDITGSNAATAGAIASQTQGTNNANRALQDTYTKQIDYLNPYASAGKGALEHLQNNDIMDGYKTSDGYKFQLAEGQKGINNNLASRGLGNSGAAQKALLNYQTGLLSQDQQQYYNNETNRLNTLLGVGSNAAGNQAAATGQFGTSLSNNYMGLGNANAAAQIGQSNQNNALLGQGLGAGALLLASDRRVKKNIVPVTKETIDEMKKELKAFYFEYQNELHGAGRYIGIMSQDLEKSPLGREIVVEVDGVKMIDTAKVMSIFLATMAEAA
jgi:hypothetical protein